MDKKHFFFLKKSLAKKNTFNKKKSTKPIEKTKPFENENKPRFENQKTQTPCEKKTQTIWKKSNFFFEQKSSKTKNQPRWEKKRKKIFDINPQTPLTLNKTKPSEKKQTHFYFFEQKIL